MTLWLRSLTVRLALLTGSWVALGCFLLWVWVVGLVSQAAERSFDARLVSLLDSLTASVDVRNGQPFLTKTVSEPKFDRPLSGVYFQIETSRGAITASRSLGDEQLPEGRTGHIGVLMKDIPGPRGQHLRMAERDFTPPDGKDFMHVIVAIALDDVLNDASLIRQRFAVGFLAFGAGLVGVVVLQVTYGLRGLLRLRSVVAELRDAGRVRGGTSIPAEVQPLFEEIDALVRQNRMTVDRARNHVGNLAHALRTRLSVMRNALTTSDRALLELELNEADRLVQHHLIRARASALSGSAGTTVSVLAVVDDIARALRVLFVAQGLSIDIDHVDEAWVRCEREDLSEMLGNLMENACKWARSKVMVVIRRQAGEIVTVVSDDGPGLTSDQLLAVQTRGVRADEQMPGSGLGLAITIDLATLYNGRVILTCSRAGDGLIASLCLPAV